MHSCHSVGAHSLQSNSQSGNHDIRSECQSIAAPSSTPSAPALLETVALAGGFKQQGGHRAFGHLHRAKHTMSGIKETKPLSEIDPEMFKLMQQEYDRQIGGLELIASEVSASCQPSECRARARRRCPSRC